MDSNKIDKGFADADLWEYDAPYAPEHRKGFIHLSSRNRGSKPAFRKGDLIGLRLATPHFLATSDPFGYYFFEANNGAKYTVKEHDVRIRN